MTSASPYIKFIHDKCLVMSLGFLLLCFCLSERALAETVSKVRLEPAPSFIDSTHERISKEILSLSNKIDSFFGDERIDDEDNESRIRFFTVTTFEESKDPFTRGRYKIQLKLPKTEKRLQLVVRSDENEDEQGQENNPNQEGTTGARENLDDTASAALRFLPNLPDIKVSTDMGLRIRGWPPQLFARARLRKTLNFGKWLFRPIEKLLWVDREGWYSQTDLNFDYRINSSWLFRYVNKINWDDQDYIVHYNTGPVWYQELSDRIGLNYSALAYFEDTPSWAANRYILSIGFRQLLYKEWFFWEITPSIAFDRESRFFRTPALAIKFEAIFGSI